MPAVYDVVHEILKLADICLFEALGEIRHGVMCDAVLGHDQNRSLAQVTNLERALGPEDFSSNVVAVDTVAALIDDTQRAVGEIETGDGVIDVSDRLHLRVR